MPTPPPPARHAWSQRGTKGAGERKANNGLWVGGVQVVPAAWAGHAAGPFAPARDANGAGPSRTVPSLRSKGTAGVAAAGGRRRRPPAGKPASRPSPTGWRAAGATATPSRTHGSTKQTRALNRARNKTELRKEQVW